MRVPADPDQPEPGQRGEHPGTGGDDHVEAAGLDLEPRPVALAGVAPHEGRRSLVEPLQQPARRGGQRFGLRNEDQRCSVASQGPLDGVDAHRRLVIGQGAEPHGSPCRKDLVAAVSLEHAGGRRSPLRLRRLGAHATLLAGHPRRMRPVDHRRQRRQVAIAHPLQDGKHRPVEEPHGRPDPTHGEDPCRFGLLRRAEDPSPQGPAVERDRHEAPDSRVGSVGQDVREGAIEGETRNVDTDVDGARQALRRLGVTRRPGGGRRPDPSPPRRSPCGRSARTRRSPDRSGGGGRGSR